MENTKENARRNVVHYLEVNKEKMSSSVMGQLMVAFCDDDEIFKYFVYEIKRKFETDINNQAICSYFLLENFAHNEVLLIFEENKEFKFQCEEFSKTICKKTIKDFYLTEIDKKIEKRFNELLIGILHCCLLNNNVDSEKFTFIVQSVLSWIDSKAKEGKLIIYQDYIAIFMLIFPVIKQKLLKIHKYTKEIEAGFSDFENTGWFKEIINISYKKILDCVNDDKISFSLATEYSKYFSVISIYYDKLGLIQQEHLLNIITKKNQHLRKYIGLDDEKILMFILLAAPMRMFKSESDLPYKVAVLINLFTDNLIQLA